MEKINIEIENEIYQNEGFHIYAGYIGFDQVSVKTDGFELTKGKKTLVGTMGTFKGKKSFQCKFEEFDYSSKQAKFNLLCSIPGIKQKTAERILNEVEDINIFNTEEYPKIKGVGPATVLLIREGLQKLESMETFKELNILLGDKCTPTKIKQLNEIVENLEDGINSFKLNPYKVLIEEAGFGFKYVDRIGLGLGIKQDNPIRIKYLVEYIVKYYTSMGNCFILKDDLKEKLLSLNIKNINEFINDNERLEIDGEKVYTVSMFEAETKIPYHLKKINNQKTDVRFLDHYDIDDLIKDFEKINKIRFDKMQIEGIKNLVNNKISILTGGAGTGKTTLLKCAIFVLKELNFRPFLAAPTGKAARRMSQATGLEATTIHRFLNIADESYTQRNGVMIIDEFSMVDTELFFDLLNVMDNAPIHFTKLILVGDPGQLPSVQPGNCLHDLILSKKISLVKLTKVFRQKGDSNIIDIATKINKNETFDLSIKKKDFYVKQINSANGKDSVLYFFDYLLNKYDNIDKFYSEVQFIAPIKKGSLGVIEINKMLKNQLNPVKNKDKLSKWFPFDKGDKVMCIQNDRENEIMNGESGRISNEDKLTFTVFYNDLDKEVTYKKTSEIIKNFQLAFCSTIHKLQGSEFKYIVIILSQDSPFMDSRLLYTGITRGKQTVIYLSNKEITDKTVNRNNLEKRNTFLKERMISEFTEDC
jgi:exodeoxyribonuclease V alpha subunit